MSIVDKVVHVKEKVHSTTQADMIEQLKQQGLFSQPVFDLLYGPNAINRSKDVFAQPLECHSTNNFSKW